MEAEQVQMVSCTYGIFVNKVLLWWYKVYSRKFLLQAQDAQQAEIAQEINEAAQRQIELQQQEQDLLEQLQRARDHHNADNRPHQNNEEHPQEDENWSNRQENL